MSADDLNLFAPISHQSSVRLMMCEPGNQLIGIYFLCQGMTVVYVGKSVDVVRRACNHPDKTYDQVWFIPVEEARLTAAERMWIMKLQPKYNVAGTAKLSTLMQKKAKEVRLRMSKKLLRIS